jgi:hypothetical protein
MYGENGGPVLAQALGIPHGTWMNYESGVAIPCHIILQFIELTGVSTHWLSTGEGPIFTHPVAAFRK